MTRYTPWIYLYAAFGFATLTAITMDGAEGAHSIWKALTVGGFGSLFFSFVFHMIFLAHENSN